jgi:hypothetical protein
VFTTPLATLHAYPDAIIQDGGQWIAFSKNVSGIKQDMKDL